MPISEQFKPLRMASPEALAQCDKCGATMTVDLVDSITGLSLIHKDPNNPKYADIACGGRFHLFQEVKRA